MICPRKVLTSPLGVVQAQKRGSARAAATGWGVRTQSGGDLCLCTFATRWETGWLVGAIPILPGISRADARL